MSQGRVVGRSPGWLSLMGLLLVAGLRKAVAADSCQNGSDESMSPHHHGDLVGWEDDSRRRKRLLVWDAPGLSRVGASKPNQGEKVPCGNPRCPGIGGRQSFKYEKAIGRGQHGWHCMACNMPWRQSWDVHFNGQPPPSWGPEKGGQHWEDYDEDEWEDDDPSAGYPAYDALDDTYKTILAKIVALPDEATRQEAIDHYRNQDSPVGKAMLAALLKPWPLGKRQKGQCFGTLLPIQLGTWMCFARTRTTPSSSTDKRRPLFRGKASKDWQSKKSLPSSRGRSSRTKKSRPTQWLKKKRRAKIWPSRASRCRRLLPTGKGSSSWKLELRQRPLGLNPLRALGNSTIKRGSWLRQSPWLSPGSSQETTSRLSWTLCPLLLALLRLVRTGLLGGMPHPPPLVGRGAAYAATRA